MADAAKSAHGSAETAPKRAKKSAKRAKKSAKRAKKSAKRAKKAAKRTTGKPIDKKAVQREASAKRATAAKKIAAKVNGITPGKNGHPNARPWSERDQRIADALIAAGESAKTVANALQRSRSSVIYHLGEEAFANRSIKQRAGGAPARALTSKEEAQALQMAAYGIPYEDIAVCLDCSVSFLTERLGDRMKAAKTKAVALVAGFLVDQARRGSTPAAKFFLTVQGGWKETKRVEVDHAAGVLVAAPTAATAEDWIEKHAKKVDATVRADGSFAVERAEDEDDDDEDEDGDS